MQTRTRMNRVNINKAMNPLTMTMNGPIQTHLIPHPNQLCHKSSALVNGQAVSSRQVSLRVSNFTLDLRNSAHNELWNSLNYLMIFSCNIGHVCVENGPCCHNALQCLLHPRPLHKWSMSQIPIAARKLTVKLDIVGQGLLLCPFASFCTCFPSQAAIISAVLRLPTTLPASSQRCKHMMFSIKAPVTLHSPGNLRLLMWIQLFYT